MNFDRFNLDDIEIVFDSCREVTANDPKSKC